MILALGHCDNGGFVIKAEIPLLKLLKTCLTNGNKNLKNDRTVNSSNRHPALNYGQRFKATSPGIEKCVRSFRGGRLRERALVSDQVKQVFFTCCNNNKNTSVVSQLNDAKKSFLE